MVMVKSAAEMMEAGSSRWRGLGQNRSMWPAGQMAEGGEGEPQTSW